MANKVFCFIPTFRGDVSATTMLATHALSQTLWQCGVAFGITAMSFPDIADLRGMALTFFYDHQPDATHLLFVDDDMGFPPQLVIDMLALNEPLVGTLYPKRTLPLEFAGRGDDNPETRGGFVKTDGVGMGITLIRRDVVTTMLEKIEGLSDDKLENSGLGMAFGDSFPLTRIIRAFEPISSPYNGAKMSEDFSFCQRWIHECGGEVWAAAHHTIQHVGRYTYQGCFMQWSQEQAAAKAAAAALEQ